MLQIFLTALILAAAVGYAVWRLVKALRKPKGGCAACEGCAFRDLMMKNMDGKNKKPSCCNKK